jgi:hypothetical protein
MRQALGQLQVPKGLKVPMVSLDASRDDGPYDSAAGHPELSLRKVSLYRS